MGSDYSFRTVLPSHDPNEGRNIINENFLFFSARTDFDVLSATTFSAGTIYLGGVKLDYRAGIETIYETGTTITFSSPIGSSGTDYALPQPWVYDSDGSSMAFSINSRTQNGFVITPSLSGTIEYIATLKK